MVEELEDFMSYRKRDGEAFIVERCDDDEYVVGRVGQKPEAFTANGIREFIGQATLNGFVKVTIVHTRSGSHH